MCIECCAAYHQKNRAKILPRLRRNGLARNYGITVERYEEMFLAQGGLCFLCRKPESGVSLAVDHCHESGAIRSLLCKRCNTALGLMNEEPALLRAAAEYLETKR